MPRLRSIRTRLTLLIFAITLAAVVVIYAYVVPQLESSLTDERLGSLTTAIERFGPPLLDSDISESELNRLVGRTSDEVNARVTLLNFGAGDFPQLFVISDSAEPVEGASPDFAVADQAARTRRVASGSSSEDGRLLLQVAQPLLDEEGELARVVVFSAPEADVQAGVEPIRRQILVAGALALAFALLAGVAVARQISRRVLALEEGAGRVAAGDFTARFPVDHDDELGQLARALDDMQRQLGELESARKRFIATASHELRTPIFSLGGFLELLESEELDDETRAQFLAMVREQVSRLGKLATDLLDLSKLEAGSLELRPEPTDVGVLARAVTSEFVPALDRHGSHLELRLGGGGHIEAVCDPERVAQVLRILIDNALTHTPPGTDVGVSASCDEGSLRLAVRDDGPGIRREALARVFEPFYTSDDAQGSGLGLAIAHELAERMDGRLTVDPTPGRTTFALELPA
jgi:signal transduction histidine kinase